jgi:hypothetical protein
LVSTLDTNINTASCGRFSEDGSQVVIGHNIGRVSILEARSGQLVKEHKLIEEYFDRPGPGGHADRGTRRIVSGCNIMMFTKRSRPWAMPR